MDYSYKDFDEFYTIRSEVLGLQNAGDTTIFRVMKKHLSDREKILDVGCGRGMFLVPFVKIGKKVVGLDYNDSNVTLLRDHGFEVRKCDCVAEIPQPDKFDAALCCEVLEHLSKEERKKLLKNMAFLANLWKDSSCSRAEKMDFLGVTRVSHVEPNEKPRTI